MRESNVQISPELVRQRATTLLRELLQSLERRGLNLETFLALTNQTAEQVEERIVAQAAGSIAGELVLEAIADDLDLQITDEEISETLRAQDEEEETIEQVLALRFRRAAAPGSAAAEGPRPRRGRGHADLDRPGGSP